MYTAIFWLTGPTNQSWSIANHFNFYVFCPIWMKFGMTTIRQKNNIEWVWDSCGFFSIDCHYSNHCPRHWWWWHQRQLWQREQSPSSSSTGLWFFPTARAPFTGIKTQFWFSKFWFNLILVYLKKAHICFFHHIFWRNWARKSQLFWSN